MGLMIYYLLFTGIDLQSLIYNLTNGIRLAQPEYCPLSIIEMLQKCFDETPNKRPDFQQIKQYLEVVYNKLFTQAQPLSLSGKHNEKNTMNIRYRTLLKENKNYSERQYIKKKDDAKSKNEKDVSFPEHATAKTGMLGHVREDRMLVTSNMTT